MVLLQRLPRRAASKSFSTTCGFRRTIHAGARDHRSRLTGIWAPSAKGQNLNLESDGSNGVLIKAGFLRQAHAGIFQIMPLGLRVQEKLERLVEKHMRHIGASKLALSSISSTDLWRKTGRITPETMTLSKYFLLCPTHEEEITKLIAEQGLGLRDLPVRVYQVSRKYRWEMRPRQGLLRSREFLMKDLYTFDASEENAMKTYHEVKDAYHRFFDELRLPYRVAEADSGNMGGSYSHEFHYPSEIGEDTLWSCNSCDYVANDELAERRAPTAEHSPKGAVSIQQHHILLKVGHKVRHVSVFMPSVRREKDIPISQIIRRLAVATGLSVDEVSPDDVPSGHQGPLDDASLKPWLDALVLAIDHAGPLRLLDTRVAHLSSQLDNLEKDSQDTPSKVAHALGKRDKSGALTGWAAEVLSAGGSHPPAKAREGPYKMPSDLQERIQKLQATLQKPAVKHKGPLVADVLPLEEGDACPRCMNGRLHPERAIELGHTFHLGQRYSKVLGAEFYAEGGRADKVPMSMGCYGIGISRMIAAIAAVKSDAKGLNWPRAVAPWEVCVIYADNAVKEDAERLYDLLRSKKGTNEEDMSSQRLDVILDDRPRNSIVQKMTDADVVGYPVMVVLGRSWMKDRKVEVQCRQLGEKTEVDLMDVTGKVRKMLAKL